MAERKPTNEFLCYNSDRCGFTLRQTMSSAATRAGASRHGAHLPEAAICLSTVSCISTTRTALTSSAGLARPSTMKLRMMLHSRSSNFPIVSFTCVAGDNTSSVELKIKAPLAELSAQAKLRLHLEDNVLLANMKAANKHVVSIELVYM